MGNKEKKAGNHSMHARLWSENILICLKVCPPMRSYLNGPRSEKEYSMSWIIKVRLSEFTRSRPRLQSGQR